MARTFVIGDVHGAYRALQQCLQRTNFDYERDRLISLGDICDGWPETYQCIEELLKIKNLIYILGNHDWWTQQWMTTGVQDEVWLTQGGIATMGSYQDDYVPAQHIDFFNKALPYYIENNKLFVHGGFIPSRPIESQELDFLMRDRILARNVINHFVNNENARFTSYDEVYLGHTPVPVKHPVNVGDVWLMDTAAGWSGVLSMMNIDTKEVFASDDVPSLYPGITGRKKR